MPQNVFRFCFPFVRDGKNLCGILRGHALARTSPTRRWLERCLAASDGGVEWRTANVLVALKEATQARESFRKLAII